MYNFINYNCYINIFLYAKLFKRIEKNYSIFVLHFSHTLRDIHREFEQKTEPFNGISYVYGNYVD